MATDPTDFWEERDAARKLTGIYANRIFVQPLSDGMLRINLGEILDDGEPTYHTAIVLTAKNAKEFAELIYRIALSSLPPPPPPPVVYTGNPFGVPPPPPPGA